MKRQLLKVYPLFLALIVGGVLFGIRLHDAASPSSPSIFQRLEWMAHDWRVRFAYKYPSPHAADQFATMAIGDSTIKWMNEKMPDQPRWPFSHFYYGPFINELKAQGVKAVAFDVFFPERDTVRKFVWPQITGTTNPVSGQDFFAECLRECGNVVLAVARNQIRRSQLEPPILQLRTNAASAHVVGSSGADSVLRGVPLFVDDRELGRIWALGVVLAARKLELNLADAEVLPDRVVLRGAGGVVRTIPLQDGKTTLLDWSARYDHPIPQQRVRNLPFERVLDSALRRSRGEIPLDFGLQGKLVVLGAGGGGVNVNDRATTALQRRDMAFLAHMSIAHSVVAGNFVRTLSLGAEGWIAFGLTWLATLLGWRLRTGLATLSVGLLATAYVCFAVWIYTAHRVLLPVALPVVGALLTTHLVFSVCRALENLERRRVEQLLKKVVSPRIIDALLAQETPMLESRRLEITVLFADLRGFTRYAEESQNQAEAAARALGLPAAEARSFADETAREAMSTVNRYLAAVADEIKASDGTLDKYMGDCVMAFWGAPLADTDHAAKALQCAIAAEQSLERLHRDMTTENERRGQENERRRAQRQPPLPLLPLLRMGIGLNSGYATVGFMGSEKHVSNYTTFGHVVNVASRVEGLTGGGQIIATDHTILAAGRNHPELVARCAELVPVLLKGVTTPVKIFEVHWQPIGSEPAAAPSA
ncbi:MAG: adenylate/guanylate cyclase domain-containing protein [Verrucomicrobia bacterium]|nr:adenylate/guanylate cyclase domain-containing protein [Verrucomicrobiota bacterium]